MVESYIVTKDKLMPRADFVKYFKDVLQKKYKDFYKDCQELLSDIKNSEVSNQTILSKWNFIQKKYFGNVKAIVQLQGVINTEDLGKIKFGAIVEENTEQRTMNINSKLVKLLEDKDKVKAEKLESAFQKHYNDFDNQLLRTLNDEQRQALYIVSYYRSRKTYNRIKRQENETYKSSIFSNQQLGKQVEAFFTHLSEEHSNFFNYAKDISKMPNNYKLSKKDCFEELFDTNLSVLIKAQNQLFDALNSTSWYKTGDIMVFDAKGKIIYNIQLKSTEKSSKSFSLSLKEFEQTLKSFFLTENYEEIANRIFDALSIKAGPAVEKLNEEIYNKAEKLSEEGLKKIIPQASRKDGIKINFNL